MKNIKHGQSHAESVTNLCRLAGEGTFDLGAET